MKKLFYIFKLLIEISALERYNNIE